MRRFFQYVFQGLPDTVITVETWKFRSAVQLTEENVLAYPIINISGIFAGQQITGLVGVGGVMQYDNSVGIFDNTIFQNDLEGDGGSVNGLDIEGVAFRTAQGAENVVYGRDGIVSFSGDTAGEGIAAPVSVSSSLSGPPQFFAVAGGSKVTGSGSSDLIFAGGQALPQMVNAGNGDDIVFSGGRGGTANGGAGNDFIAGGSGGDVISGGSGDDIISGGAGTDILSGGDGRDILAGRAGADTFQFMGNFGADTITDLNFAEGDKLNFYAGSIGEAGSFYSTHNTTITSLGGLVDLIQKTDASVTQAASGSVTIKFGGGNTLSLLGFGTAFGFSEPANGNSAGSSSDDILIGGNGKNAHLVGGAGNDILLAGRSGDLLEGNTGEDKLLGGAGDDRLSGQSGSDILTGGAGNDVLNGGEDDDFLQGDNGGDTFQFGGGIQSTASAFGDDTIADLNFAEGDRIQFLKGAIDENSPTITLSSIDQLVSFIAAGTSQGLLVALPASPDGNSVAIAFGQTQSSVTIHGYNLWGMPVS